MILHGLRTQVEVAVLEPEVFVGVGFFVNLEGQHSAFRQHDNAQRLHFDMSGCHFRVDHGIGTLPHCAFNGNTIFHLQTGCDFL